MFERVLIPTDFSPASARALAVARGAFPGASKMLLHVLDARAVAVPDLTTGGMVPVAPPPDVQREFGQTDKARLAELLQGDEEGELVSGDPLRAILQVSADWNADLIVTGTQGREGLTHFFLGSLAEHLVRESPVPVLTVREKHGA